MRGSPCWRSASQITCCSGNRSVLRRVKGGAGRGDETGHVLPVQVTNGVWGTQTDGFNHEELQWRRGTRITLPILSDVLLRETKEGRSENTGAQKNTGLLIWDSSSHHPCVIILLPPPPHTPFSLCLPVNTTFTNRVACEGSPMNYSQRSKSGPDMKVEQTSRPDSPKANLSPIILCK